MKILYGIVSALVFCCAMFLKFNRAARIMDQANGGESVFEKSESPAYSSYLGQSKKPVPFSSGIQSNPYAQ